MKHKRREKTKKERGIEPTLQCTNKLKKGDVRKERFLKQKPKCSKSYENQKPTDSRAYHTFKCAHATYTHAHIHTDTTQP